MPVIHQLLLYPIKSCAGIAAANATVCEAGLAYGGVRDREWMLVSADGVFLSQRELPRMALIRPTIEGDYLTVNAPGMSVLSLPIAPPDAATVAAAAASAATRTVSLWDEASPAFDQGDEVAAWFSTYLAQPCRLVRCHPATRRLANTKWTGELLVPTLFSDGFPLLLISTASLADLNQKLLAEGRAALPMSRFRPNIVVDGVDAFEEDYTESIIVDKVERSVVIKPVKPCPRCPIPSVDQTTGEFGPDPLDILRTYRANPLLDGAVTFGMNVIVTQGAGQTICVGDAITMTLAFD